MESLAGASTAASDFTRVHFELAHVAQLAPMASAERRQSNSDLLRRHTDRTAILREVGRQSLFLIGYFLKMLATLLSAMERRISAERRAIIDHDTILCALSHDGNVHASDKRSVIVKEINIRPSGALRD